LPVYLAVPIEDRQKADLFIDELREGLLVQSAKRGGARFALKYDAYDLGGPDERGPIHAMSLELFAFKFRLFYTIHDDFLLVATRPEVLRSLVEGSGSGSGGDPFNMRLSLFPGRWNRLKSDMQISYEEAARRQCLRSLHEFQPFLSPGLDKMPATLEREYGCPDSGTYGVGEESELCCTVHGSPTRPRQEPSPMPENPVSRILDDLDEVTFSLCFTEHGIRCSIRIRR